MAHMFNQASDVDASHSHFYNAGHKIEFHFNDNPTKPEHADVPRLVYELTVARDGGEQDSRIIPRVTAAEGLVHVAKSADGPDRIAIAVLNAGAVSTLVGYLSTADALRQHTILILTYILRFQQTWEAALGAQVVPRLVEGLSANETLETQIGAAGALSCITLDARGMREAVDAKAMPLLVAALSHISHKLRKMAVRAVRNITSLDAGRRAAYTLNAMQPLVALLDSSPLDFQIQYDATQSLLYIACLGKVARREIKSCGAVEKLKGISHSNAPEELQAAVVALKDELKTWT